MLLLCYTILKIIFLHPSKNTHIIVFCNSSLKSLKHIKESHRTDLAENCTENIIDVLPVRSFLKTYDMGKNVYSDTMTS